MKLLLAVDGSEFTDRMLDFVLSKSHWPGPENEFVVFNCVPPWPHRAAAFEALDVVTRYYQEDAESVLEPIRRVIESSGIHVSYRHAVGAAAHAISGMAQREGFDVVVMGSHGHGGLANVVLGSVTTAVNDVVAGYLRELSEKELKPARKLLDAAGVRHDMVIKTGLISQEIVDFARSSKFDLLVLGAKGRSAIADMLLGSVAQRVLATATCPVLLVK